MSHKKCPKCNGKGNYINVFLSHKCEFCNGTGVIEDFNKEEESQMNYLQSELDELVDELALIQDMFSKVEKSLDEKERYNKQLEKELDEANDALEEVIEENRELKKKLQSNKKPKDATVFAPNGYKIPMPKPWAPCGK